VVVLVRRHSVPPPVDNSSGVDRAQALKASSVLGNGSSDGLGVPLESVPGKVGDVIACLVVVNVKGNTGLAAEELSLFSSLDDLSTSEKTTRGDAKVEETSVVATPGEVSGDRVETVGREELLEEDLSLATASGTGLVESTSVTVVDAENVVGRGDHVEVEVQADLGGLFGGEVLGVVVRAEQTELLGGPEADADGVVDCVAGELLSNFEDTDDAGAVVVDTRAGLHRVGVTTNDEDGVLVAANSLCNDVLTMDN
jgi:hypothetical protein